MIASWEARNSELQINVFELKKTEIYFIQGACRVSREPNPRSNYSPSPPMKLMTSQSLPPSSASSVIIMSHLIDLAGLAHRKNYLTLQCFWYKTLIKVTKSPLPNPLVFAQNKAATNPRIGLDLGSLLTPSKTASPLFFCPATLAWTREMPLFKRKLSGHLLAKWHRYIYILKTESLDNAILAFWLA